jgi:AbrB family looped-hinge helix DNA binding protein
MTITTKIDRAGRIVIPKSLRERYGLDEGVEIELLAVPDGITLVPALRAERTIVRNGNVVAIDTGGGVAPTSVFSSDQVRDNRLDRVSGFGR